MSNLITRKRKLTDELKDMPLDNLPNVFQDNELNVLKNIGIYTLGQLLQADTKKLYDMFKTEYSSYFNRIRRNIMYQGYLFEEDRSEFEGLGISEELALVTISDLSVSQRIKTALKRYDICFLGDLLNYPYNELIRVSKLGEISLAELKEYIHSLGFSLMGEQPTIEEKIKEYKEKGIKLIQEELGLSGKLSNTLYKNGIFTIEELCRYGESVFKLVGMGKVRKLELKAAMEKHNIQFNPVIVSPNSQSIVPPQEVVKELGHNNAEIGERIGLLEQLLTVYRALIQEQEALAKQEEDLKKQIEALFVDTQKLINGGKTKYGG